MRWYVEPLADQRSFNAAALRLIDDLEARVAAARGRAEAARDENRRLRAAGAVRRGRRRDLRGHARRRAARARPRGRARHGAVQVVSRHARARPGVPLAAARPEEADGRPIDLVVATKFPSYCVRHPEQARLGAAPVPAGLRARPHRARASSPSARGPGAAARGPAARPRSRSARRSGCSRPRATSPSGSSARPGSRPR